MKLKEFLETKIKNKEIEWSSKTDLLRAAGKSVNGNSIRVLKKFENKFLFKNDSAIKDKEITRFFIKQKNDSYINVSEAARIINSNLPKDIIVGETIIINRLNDKNFNKNNLKPQTLDNQISKFREYDVDIKKDLIDKIESLKNNGIYLNIENTKRGSKVVRLRIQNSNKIHGNNKIIFQKTFPPNESSIVEIKKIIKENS